MITPELKTDRQVLWTWRRMLEMTEIEWGFDRPMNGWWWMLFWSIETLN